MRASEVNCAAPIGVARAAEEIVSSEKSFVDDMKVLRNIFLGPLSEYLKLLDQGIVRADEIRTPQELALIIERLLFALDGVLDFGTNFFNEIKETESRGTWRQVFEKHEAAMAKNLGRYVAAYNAVWSEFCEYRKKSTAIEAFLRCCELQPGNTRHQTLASLAIMPVQRGPRYVLLLDELQKRAQKASFTYERQGGDDEQALEDALACARRAAKAIDAEIRAEESRRAELRRVANVFLNSETVKSWTLSTCKRSLVRDDSFRRTTQRRGGVDSYFVIFDTHFAYGDNSSTETVSGGASSTLKRIRRRSTASISLPMSPSSLSEKPPSPTNSSVTTDVGTKRFVYALRKDFHLQDCYAARGDDRLGGLMSSASSIVALDPWEVLVSCGDEAFILATPTPTVAAEWVDTLNKTADQCRLANLTRSKEHFFVSAHVYRQSRVTMAEYELARLSSGSTETYLARPRGAMGIIPMPPSRPTDNTLAKNKPVHAQNDSPRTAAAAVLQLEAERPSINGKNGQIMFPEDADFTPPESVTLTVRLGPEGLGIELRNEGSDQIVVTNVAVPSAAHDAGLRRGDTISAVSNMRVQTTDDVVALLHTLAATGHTDLALLVKRDTRGRSGQYYPSPDEFMPPSSSNADNNTDEPNSTKHSSSSPTWSSSQAQPFAENALENANINHKATRSVSSESVESQALAMGFNPDDVVRAVEAGATELNDIALWIIDHADDNSPNSPTAAAESSHPPPPPYSVAIAQTHSAPRSAAAPPTTLPPPTGGSRMRRNSSPPGSRLAPPPRPNTPPPSPPSSSNAAGYSSPDNQHHRNNPQTKQWR